MMVLELITGKLARMLAGTAPVLTGLEAVNAAVNVIGLELVRRKSDLSQQEISLNYAAGVTVGTLPDGFMGFISHPRRDDGAELHRLLDSEKGRMLTAENGVPEYYEFTGSDLYLYPAPDVATTIKATIKVVPGLKMTDSLPWRDLFNDLIAVAAVQLSQQGLALLAAPAFLAMIDKGVSAVLVPRQNPLPRRRPVNFF